MRELTHVRPGTLGEARGTYDPTSSVDKEKQRFLAAAERKLAQVPYRPAVVNLMSSRNGSRRAQESLRMVTDGRLASCHSLTTGV